jgi:hypothetical protein
LPFGSGRINDHSRLNTLRIVEASAEVFFGVEELSQLKAWDYDGVIRFLVDYQAGISHQTNGSDRSSLPRAGESPAAL